MARDAAALLAFLRSSDSESADASAMAAGTPITQTDVEDLNRPDALRLAMAAHRKVALTYRRKRDGATDVYFASPYSLRERPWGRVLYATEERHGAGQIHGFQLSRVSEVRVLPSRRFPPRWPTEPETV